VIDDRPMGAPLSRNLGSLTAPGEAVGHDLNALITRRHDQRVKDEGHRPSEVLWAASERAYFARRDEDRCLERLTYHEGQGARLSDALGALAQPGGEE
jgi:hypothetical protein